MIGITMRAEIETRRFYLGRDYSEAVARAGGNPIHIPLIPDETMLRETVAGLDGILLPGSESDIDPELYGEDPHQNTGRTVPEKDATDLLVLKLADEFELPVFGICFGMQALNVHRGGSLIQDINSQVENPIKHEQGVPRDHASHFVKLVKGTRLDNILNDGEMVKVNSHHHQAIKLIGKGLTATAHSSDGIIEAVEDPTSARFVLGVQWHPELSTGGTDPVSVALFEKFVSAAADFGAERREPFR